MDKSTKPLSRLLLLLILVCGLSLQASYVSGARTPSVPEFTVELLRWPIDDPSSTTKVLHAMIKNNIGASYYNFRYKRHYDGEWRYYRFDPDSRAGYNVYSDYFPPNDLAASTSDYTAMRLTFLTESIPKGEQVDLQVQALFGDYIKGSVASVHTPGGMTYDFYFNGTTSNWSPTQTFTIGENTQNNSNDSTNPSSKPSVPEFTMSYKDLSYDTPTTYEIDEFTGENVTKNEGYHVDKRSVVFTIKNQPFTPYTDTSGNEINLYFNFKFKGNFGDEWRHYPFSETGRGTRRHSTLYYTFESPKLAASNTEYTNITLSLPFLFGYAKPPIGSQVDFQVQALIGHIDPVGSGYYNFTGQKSDWSATQTITVGEETPVTTPDTPKAQDDTTLTEEPTSSDNPPTSENTTDSQEQETLELTWVPKDNESIKVEEVVTIIGIAAVFVAIAVGVVHFRLRKR